MIDPSDPGTRDAFKSRCPVSHCATELEQRRPGQAVVCPGCATILVFRYGATVRPATEPEMALLRTIDPEAWWQLMNASRHVRASHG